MRILPHFLLPGIGQHLAVQIHGDGKVAVAQNGFQGLGIPALFNVASGEGVPQGVGGKGGDFDAPATHRSKYQPARLPKGVSFGVQDIKKPAHTGSLCL